MIKKLLFAGFAGLFTVLATAQTSTSATYNAGPQEVERSFTAVTTATETVCADTLIVTIPAGNYIYSVDVEYDLAAFGAVWTSDLRTYLECVTTSQKEGAVTSGTINTNGVESFSRSGLLFTTGIAANGQLKFVLHAFRNFGVAGCDSTNANIVDSTFKVTVLHGPPPTCFPPSALQVNWTMSNKANLSWLSGGATNWQIEYGTAGFTLGSGTLINATSNPFTINGLTANTNYDFYVRDSCGSSNVSIWSAVNSFYTICAPSASPFTENFDGTGWTAGTGGQNTGDAIGSCWERNPIPAGGFGGPFSWGTRTGTTATANTGPTGDNTTGSANYIYTEASQGAYQNVAIITSPLIDLGALTVPEVEFYYHMFGASCGQLYVDVWNHSGGWQNVYSKSGQQQTSSAQAWNKESVTLNQFADDTVRVRFRVVRSFQADGDISIDDVKLKEAPSCPKPSGLIATAVLPTSVILDWTAVGASSWDISRGPVGFAPGSGIKTNVTAHPATVNGLTPGTTYYFYVREHCSSTDTSDWIGPLAITTLCNPISAPFFENFDGASWTSGTGTYNTADALATCWIRNPAAGASATDPYFWGARTLATTTPGTGPNTDKSGTGRFVYTEASAGAPSQNATLSVPYLSLTTLTNPELRFWYHMFGSGMGTLSIDVYSSSTGANLGVFTLTGQKTTGANGAWQEAIISLSAFTNDTVLIVFRGIRGSSNLGDIAIDEVSVDNAPTCPDPSLLTSSNVTSNSVDLAWVTGGATNWNVASGPTGFTPGATFASATSNPFTLTGLAPGTAYDIYVRDSCGTNDVSNWIGPISIFTLCAPVAAPYAENFDGTTWTVNGNNAPGVIDPCWTRTSTATYWWKPRTGATPSVNTGPIGDHTSGTGKYMYTETGNGGTTTSLLSPLIDVSGLTSPELSFYYHMFGIEINKLDVEVNNGGAWVVVSTITGAQQTSSADAWLDKIVDLSAYAGDTIQVRFTGTRNAGFNNRVDISIDDFDLHEAPSCPQPTNLATTAATANSVTLSWTTGGATAWQIEYGPVGFLPGAGTIVAAPTNPFTVTGLSGSSTYDFYVRDDCGAGDTSLWVGPVTNNTLCVVANAPYLETFDYGFDEGTGAQNAGSTIGACWTRTPATGFHWGGGTAGTPSAGTGPTADHTTGNGNYAYAEASGAAGTPPEALLLSPFIEMSALTNPLLTFWYHYNGAGIGGFEVEIYDGSTWTSELIVATAQGPNWLEVNIPLTSYATDTIQVRFTSTKATGGQNFSSDVAIDDFKVAEAPSCPPPTALSALAVLSNSVNLTWTTGGAINWNVAFGTPGFTPGTTFSSAAAIPYSLTGLTPGTNYDIYVRDSCGAGDVSSWFGPISIQTLCAPSIAPYTENFDGTSWTVNGNGAPGVIDPCWTRSTANIYWWKPRTGATPSNNTGPQGDHTSGTGKYMYTETQNNGTSTILYSPLIDLSALTVPELSFYYHMFGALIDKLEVEINDGTGWTLITTKTGQQQSTSASAWFEEVVSLSAYANDTIQLRFVASRSVGNLNTVDISIDDIDIHEAPNCPKPSNLAVTSTTSNSATLSWTTGGATNWHIEYGPVGFINGAGTLLVATTNPFVVTGLTPNTSYHFYVRDSCGLGDVSAWEGPVNGTTPCGTYTAPFTENFDGASWIVGVGGFAAGVVDPCWVRSSSTQYWWRPGTGATPTGNTGPSGDHTSGSGKYLYTESQAGSTQTSILTPQIDLDTLSTPELRFWYHMYGALMLNLHLEINDGTGWANLDSVLAPQQTGQTAPWQEKVIDLSAYVGDVIQLRFSGNKIAGNTNTADISIDDVSIGNAPSCPEPTLLSSTASTTTSVTLAWTSGGATNWQIEYGPVGFTNGAGTLVNAATNPFTVTGLSPAQSYNFYVRDSCGLGEVSFWLGPITAQTACGTVLAPYFENFDIDFDEGTGLLNDGSTINACWTRNPDSAYHWGGGAGPTGTAGTGPTADHTSGFGNYVYVEASSTPNGSVARLETPSINLTGLASPEMHFWYHMWAQNGTMGSLRWEVFSNNVWTVLDSIVGTQGNSWQEQVVNLSAYTNQTIKIRFRGRKRNGATPQQGDMAIDDLSIIAAPTCPDPAALVATTQTNTSVQLSWTTGGATAWEIEYGPAGFAPGSGTLVSATSNPFIVTGLAQGTCYDFYVRDVCGPTDKSNWAGASSACTFSCANGCAYTLNLTDTFGDGWTGNGPGTIFHSVNLTVGTTTTNYTLADGFDTTFTINVCDGDTLLLSFVTNGNWSNECGVIFRDANNVVIFQNTGPMATGQLFAGSSSCNNPCPTPTASFSNAKTLLSVAFDANASIGTSLIYDWDFGDGTTGTGASPTHVYGQDGVYTVQLIVTDICGQDDTITQTVTVCQPLFASFSWSQNGLAITVDASSLTNATAYNWQFGDGTTDTGAVATHPYASTGTYAVKLTVSNICGQTADTTIIITVCVKPAANWTYTILSSGGNGMTVQFNASSSTSGSSFNWTFGDGGTNNVSAIPVHTYAVPGLFYIVRLIVYNNCGDSDTLESSLAKIDIEEFTEGDVLLYPNPALDFAALAIPLKLASQELEITIVDLKGAIVAKTTSINAEIVELPISELPAGSYVVTLKSDEMVLQKRLIINK